MIYRVQRSYALLLFFILPFLYADYVIDMIQKLQ